MAGTKHQALIQWVEEMATLTTPDAIVWLDGSQHQLDTLKAEGLATGEFTELGNNCLLHRTAAHDVARMEDRTFICSPTQQDAGPTNNWMAPKDMYDKLTPLFSGSMKGRTMYVIPYSMGIIGSPFAKYGVELTDSIYVALSMDIMTRIGDAVLEALGEDGTFVKGLHAKSNLDPEQRYIAHFPADNAIWSINSGYGGNVLLGKKCFALRIASNQARQEGWMAEHMLILGIQNPQREVHYVAAAFPSACGKTNLAMLLPPSSYKKKGWRIWCVGDDIAWIRPGSDGRLWAVNPEYGFFGVAPGTSVKSNPSAIFTTQSNTIFTNVAHSLENNMPWWEGINKLPPTDAIDWQGRPWNGRTSHEKGAHPNSRFTAPATNCPCLSPEFDNPQGVPLSAIIFGGRRAKTAPLVYQSRDWNHGVFVGATMASETTAAAAGAVGVVRRDPMAMLPFCGYHMGDYFQHWLDMGQSVANPPKIFHVNWFRTNEEGQFMWPGFGENIRVLEWIIHRCYNQAEGHETPIGILPHIEDLNLDDLDIGHECLSNLLKVSSAHWLEDTLSIRTFFDKLGDALPKELSDQLDQLEAALKEEMT